MVAPEIAARIFSPSSPLPAEPRNIQVAEAHSFVTQGIHAITNNEALAKESFPTWFAVAPETDMSVVLEQSYLSLSMAGSSLSETEQNNYTSALRIALERESGVYKAEGNRLQVLFEQQHALGDTLASEQTYTTAQQMFERAHIRAAKLLRTAEHRSWEEVPDPVYMKKDLVAHVTITDPSVHAQAREMLASIVDAKSYSWFIRAKIHAEHALASMDPEALQSAYNSFSVAVHGVVGQEASRGATGETREMYIKIRDGLRTAKLEHARKQFETIRTQSTEAEFWNIVKSLNLVDFLNNGGQSWDGSSYNDDARYIPVDQTHNEQSATLRDQVMARINEIQWEHYNPFSTTSIRPVGAKPVKKAA